MILHLLHEVVLGLVHVLFPDGLFLIEGGLSSLGCQRLHELLVGPDCHV